MKGITDLLTHTSQCMEEITNGGGGDTSQSGGGGVVDTSQSIFVNQFGGGS